MRERDRDRYIATLFAPAGRREALFALYAFDAEVAHVRDAVSNPLPGEVRLQWWHDVIDGVGSAGGHPVATALLDAVERHHLPRKALTDLLEAHIFDLYDDPMPAWSDLEGYCGETASAMVRLASLVLAGEDGPGPADAAGHAGMAIGLAAMLRALPRQVARQQCFVPVEVLTRHGVGPDDLRARSTVPGVIAAIDELRTAAWRHLDKAVALVRGLPGPVRPAFLPLGATSLYLRASERTRLQPFASPPEVAPWRRQWAIWRLSRRLA